MLDRHIGHSAWSVGKYQTRVFEDENFGRKIYFLWLKFLTGDRGIFNSLNESWHHKNMPGDFFREKVPPPPMTHEM